MGESAIFIFTQIGVGSWIRRGILTQVSDLNELKENKTNHIEDRIVLFTEATCSMQLHSLVDASIHSAPRRCAAAAAAVLHQHAPASRGRLSAWSNHRELAIAE